ncbi:MAG: tyrosine-type recombinase/integrase [Deltaproteobacteria bacterium]|nr:tyrosine-type recombinase/integrase [Deltaproteobacteria bacterium]
MGSVYKRGDRYYVRFRDLRGVWRARSAGRSRDEARRVLRDIERGLREPPTSIAAPVGTGPTLREVVPGWIDRRRRRGLRDWATDRGRLEKHVLPVLGSMPVGEIRVRHIVSLIESLAATELAPRSVRKVYGTLHKLLADLVVDELVASSPCVLTKDQLPKNRDRDSEWRAGAVFARDEVELLISSDQIPVDRQMLYGLLFLLGARIGEVAGLRWRDIDERAAPLHRITIAHSYEHGTKTEMPRSVPVHPTLAAMLAEWKLSSFAKLTGRPPTPDDLVIPSREGRMRSRHHTRNKFLEDLARLGLRHRRVHDTRRTFITLARVDGARKDVLEQITHAVRGDIMNLYTTLPWPTLCEAVSVLKIERRGAAVISLRRVVNGDVNGPPEDDSDGGADADGLVTGLVTAPRPRQQSARILGMRRGGGAGSRTF